MHFQILKLILWPRHNAAPRELAFEPNMVNVISGASKTGKSAVIPIIDYCLGARQCSIPVGVIRDACSWFGVIVDTGNGPFLFARREPGGQKYVDDFVVKRGLDVPETIEGKTHSLQDVKDILDRLSNLSRLRFSADRDEGWKERTGFRDLMAFVFQPQNIVANPDVLFFKADTTEHRERLKTILPYVLGAITPRTLAARGELAALDKTLKRINAQIRSLEQTAERWSAEGYAWLQQAMELGVTPTRDMPGTWPELLSSLRLIVDEPMPLRLSPTQVEGTIQRMAALRERVRTLTGDAHVHRQRLAEVEALAATSRTYGGAVAVKRERLALSEWLRQRSAPTDDPIGAGASRSGVLDQLCDALAETEVQLRLQPVVVDTVDREAQERKAALAAIHDEVNAANRELRELESATAENRTQANRMAFAERFVGRLEQALRQYDDTDGVSALRVERDGLLLERARLTGEIDEQAIKRRTEEALTTLERLTGRLVPMLDGEWTQSPVRLNPKELTVEVYRDDRKYFLWEIGSGANWLAYHVSVLVALQQFFAGKRVNEVPGLLVFDQPSQVYFPKRVTLADVADSDGAAEDRTWRHQDIEAVRSVFRMLGAVVSEADPARGLQIIVLDHADAEVWGNLEGVTLCERWRDGTKLVPQAWLD